MARISDKRCWICNFSIKKRICITLLPEGSSDQKRSTKITNTVTAESVELNTVEKNMKLALAKTIMTIRYRVLSTFCAKSMRLISKIIAVNPKTNKRATLVFFSIENSIVSPQQKCSTQN